MLGHVHNYPRLLDDEQGPPTRGMGQVAPAPDIDETMLKRIFEQVLEPTIEAMAERGTPLHGALFVDLMLVRGQPVVIDYNVRFGDPATQILLSRLSGDFYRLLLACEGYPESYMRGAEITLNEEPFEDDPDLWLFEDAVRWIEPGEGRVERLETVGGRAYTIVAAADTVAEARAKAYAATEHVQFEGRQLRSDIGKGF